MKRNDFQRKKALGKKISVITCYDYPSARIVADTNIDCVLVGDSVAMVIHGYESTIMATMDMMVLHTSAVARGLKGQQFIVSDVPFLCHRGAPNEVIQNVRRLLQAGAQAIKIEGGDEETCKIIDQLVTAGVPVMGHIGLTPQSVLELGGYRVQGKDPASANHLLAQARQLEAAGCFALVIECVPQSVARTITQAITIPTIGIGAGADTDGQVLVWHDMLGLQSEFKLHFVKQYLEGKTIIQSAINDYVQDVEHLLFPAEEHSF